MADVLTHLEKRLNFTTKAVIPEDGMWGGLDETGRWNGLVGMLVQGHVFSNFKR